jgi:predicted nicotinamide N-methyase
MRRFSEKQIQRVIGKYNLVENKWPLVDGVEVELVEVADLYELLDRMIEQEGRMVRVERFPYWAEIWPASLALAKWMCSQKLPPPRGWTRELGCGIGLVGVALAKLGWKVEATDYVEDALAFAAHNAQKNRVADRHRVSYLDWSNPVGKACECLVASDVVYEKKNHVYLNRVLRTLLEPGGRFYLSDPKRRPAERFVAMLLKQRYAHEVETVNQTLGTVEYQVDIHVFTKGKA